MHLPTSKPPTVNEGIVKSLVGWIVYRDEFGYAGVTSGLDASPKVMHMDRKMGWAASVNCQALNRYTNYIYFTVAMMFKSSGFKVHDLGVDVKSAAFIGKAKETNADIIALSSLLTTTLPYQREVIDDLKAAGLRERYKVIVGGGPATPEWAERIGADGYGRDAMEGLAVAKKLVGIA